MPIEGVQIKGMSQADIQRITASNTAGPAPAVNLTSLPTDVNQPRRNTTTPSTGATGVNLSAGTLTSLDSLTFNASVGADKAIYKSLLHYILIKKIQTASVEQATTAIMTQDFEIKDLDKYVPVTKLPFNFNRCYLYELGITRRDEEGKVLNGDGVGEGPSEVFFSYIRMGLFIEILNNVVLRDRTVPIFSFNTAGDSSTFDVSFYEENRFATHKDHISVDPAVCLLPRNNHFGGDETGNRIYDIYLNIDFLIRTLESLISDNPEVDLITYLESLLATIERVTGNFNEYQVQYFEESHSFAVVDRKYLKRTTLADIPEINIIGTGSVVKSFNLNSLLSPQISKMVAISAQAGGTDLGLEATAFKKLNEGLRDNVIRTRGVGNLSKEGNEAEQEARNSELEGRLEAYLDLLYTFGQYVSEDVENIIVDYVIYTKQLLGEEDKPEYSFILPFELTLVLEGISGFRIMESFRVNPQVLPKMYLRKTATRVAFLITGLEQKVTKAGWDTIVKAQMYLLPSGIAGTDSTNNILASRLGQQKRRTGERKQGSTTSLSGRYSTSKDNNPYNIRPIGTAVNFNGVTGQKEGFRGDKSIGYFLVFDELNSGIRAGMKNLVNGYFKKDINTVSTIISRYAPSSDGNNTTNYINGVVTRMQSALVGTSYEKMTASTKLSFAGNTESNADNIKMFKELNKAILIQEGGGFATGNVDSFNIANLK